MSMVFRGYRDAPPAGPVKDNVFFNNTTKKLYRYDGKKWVEFEPDIRIYEAKPDDPYKAYDRAMGII